MKKRRFKLSAFAKFFQKYVPPITASSPNLPETPDEIVKELGKQESLLAQIHAEMQQMSEHAGYVTKRREEQLWEVQRIITQLKRKLKSFEKKGDNQMKSSEDTVDGDTSIDLNLQQKSDESSIKTIPGGISTVSANDTETKNTPQETPQDETANTEEKEIEEKVSPPSEQPLEDAENPDRIMVDENGFLTLPQNHAEFLNLIQLQLENQELNKWKYNLQNRINAERAEIVRMKKLLIPDIEKSVKQLDLDVVENEEDYERLMNQYLKENLLLEQKKLMLAKEIFDEKQNLIQMQVDLALSKFVTRT